MRQVVINQGVSQFFIWLQRGTLRFWICDFRSRIFRSPVPKFSKIKTDCHSGQAKIDCCIVSYIVKRIIDAISFDLNSDK